MLLSYLLVLLCFFWLPKDILVNAALKQCSTTEQNTPDTENPGVLMFVLIEGNRM